MSTRREIIKAVSRPENPKEQKALGRDTEDVPAPGDIVHSLPPLLHSHVILSCLRMVSIDDKQDGKYSTDPRWSWTIMKIARIAVITIMKGQRDFDTSVSMYDRYMMQ
jgi:hypothetical protein